MWGRYWRGDEGRDLAWQGHAGHARGSAVQPEVVMGSNSNGQRPCSRRPSRDEGRMQLTCPPISTTTRPSLWMILSSALLGESPTVSSSGSPTVPHSSTESVPSAWNRLYESLRCPKEMTSSPCALSKRGARCVLIWSVVSSEGASWRRVWRSGSRSSSSDFSVQHV